MEVDIKTMPVSSLEKLKKDIDNEITRRARSECFARLDLLVNLIKEIRSHPEFNIVFLADGYGTVSISEITEVYDTKLGISRPTFKQE